MCAHASGYKGIHRASYADLLPRRRQLIKSTGTSAQSRVVTVSVATYDDNQRCSQLHLLPNGPASEVLMCLGKSVSWPRPSSGEKGSYDVEIEVGRGSQPTSGRLVAFAPGCRCSVPGAPPCATGTPSGGADLRPNRPPTVDKVDELRRRAKIGYAPRPRIPTRDRAGGGRDRERSK